MYQHNIFGINKGEHFRITFIRDVHIAFSDLCTAFSATFRKQALKESMECVIFRNMEFANMSRLLIEAVQVFGRDGLHNTGPFYCGMSNQMVLPQFRIQLHSPTSTSRTIAVAHNFGDMETGMVIQLNNNNAGWEAKMVRSFATSWLGDFPEEDEFLFAAQGGFNWKCGLRVDTVTLQDTRNNYKKFFKPLFWFHCMITGQDNIEINVTL